MTSPYRAHFEVRDKTRGLVIVMCLCAFSAAAVSLVGHAALWLRITAGLGSIAFLAVAWGVHRAREWARIAGIVLAAAAALSSFFSGNAQSNIEILIGCGGLVTWLALPATKTTFATAREMIRRTEDIKREQGAKRELYKRRMRERSATRP